MKELLRFALLAAALACCVMRSSAQSYVLLGWNDLGMHCANQDFSRMAVLPPFNNIYAQLIVKTTGQTPRVATNGYFIEYSIPGNTYSVGKTNFWTYAQRLFGLAQPLPDNIGLTGKGLTGKLDRQDNYFCARGIPVTPFPDTSLAAEDPFQLIHLVARDSLSGAIVATTDVVIPVSNELSCVQSGCHASEQSIVNNHPAVDGYATSGPILCATCHADNALGMPGATGVMPMSEAMHHQHANLNLPRTLGTCYKCHPGPRTQCLRDVMSSADAMDPMICEDCHGTLDMVAHSISHDRRPWLDEPKCGSTDCHGSMYAEEPGKLYRESKAHGGLFCAACHNSPHAILPSREANDNLQTIRLQGEAGTLKQCIVCHDQDPTGPGPHEDVATTVAAPDNAVPRTDQLMQNYPNPFNPTTTIAFTLAEDGPVTLKVFDMLGRDVATLIDGGLKAGAVHSVRFNAAGLPSGMYCCRLQTRTGLFMRKLMLLK
jgi:hypothetical protein